MLPSTALAQADPAPDTFTLDTAAIATGLAVPGDYLFVIQYNVAWALDENYPDEPISDKLCIQLLSPSGDAVFASVSPFPYFNNGYDKGLSAGAGDQHGTVLYNRGMLAAMLAVEAARTAQGIHGTAKITPAMMRDGMENLEITDEKLEALGLKDFVPTFTVSCANHGAPGLGAIQQWNAKDKTWKIISPFIAADRDVVDPLIEEDSAAYAAEAGITPRACE